MDKTISMADVEQTIEDNILCYTHSDRPIDQDPDTECHMAIRTALRMLRKDLRKLPPAPTAPDVKVATDINVGDKDTISRAKAIEALWKALHEYEDKTEKQFQESDELDISDWLLHRIFVQNMSDIDRQTILNLPPTQPEHIRGRWIYTGVKFPNWEGQIVSEAICSKCNGISYFRRAFDKFIGANFCPNCGSDNREEK